MNVSLLPRELDIYIKKNQFQNFSLYRLDYWIEKNGSNTQPKSPLQEEFSFQRAASSIHPHQICTVQEHQGGQKKIQKGILPEESTCEVPNILAFTRILKPFQEESSLRPQVPAGRSSEPLRNNIEAVKKFFEQNPKLYIREAARVLGLSYGAIWIILRKNLKWRAYRPHLTQCLSPANKESRLAACTFWLTFEEEWFQRVIWSDEKWFVLKQSPNKQICRYWAPSNPHTVIECKKAHGEKVMAWVGTVDGRILPVVWFQGISEFERIPGTSPQEYCLAISEKFGNTTSILVPARWRQLPRNGRVPRFSSCKIWRENNFTKDNSPLAPILSGLVASRLLILVPSNGTYNQVWAKHSNGAQEHRGRLRRGHEGRRYSEDGATYQEKSRAVQG